MSKLTVAAVALLMVASGCLGGGGEEKTVFVDFQHDEFASFFIRNFPRQVTVAQGDEIVFRQYWTGEPHSVTGGTLADELMEVVRPYVELLDRGEPIPEEPPKDVMKLEERLVASYPMEGQGPLNQTAAQPCYLESGEPRKDGKPCTESQQTQPVFDGKQTFYNSGLIPYEGPEGNEYTVKMADDIDPGSYWFYCNVHGALQSTEVVVKPKGAKVPTAEEISRDARSEIRKFAGPLLKLFRDGQDKRVTMPEPGGRGSFTMRGNFAGLFYPSDFTGSVNEFLPGRIEAEAGEEIEWNLMGFHSISFGVPKYLPIITFDEDGTVTRNPRLDPAAGGAKKFDLPPEELFGGEEPIEFDGGAYDGEGFWSSGVISAEPYIRYKMRITKPGSYRYACLIHPPMVGTVEVT